VTPRLLVAHGSPDKRSAATVRRIAERAGAIATFLDFDRPDPRSTISALVAAGHDRITMVPLLLTDAHHHRVDLPAIVAASTERHPELSIAVDAPIGGAHLVPALARGLPPADAVILAAAGTRHGPARDAIDVVAAALGERLGLPCSTAYATGEPGVGDEVARLRGEGFGRVAVASYFIAPGVLHDRARNAALDAGAVAVTPPLGTCPEVLAVCRPVSPPTVRPRLRGLLVPTEPIAIPR